MTCEDCRCRRELLGAFRLFLVAMLVISLIPIAVIVWLVVAR